MKDQFRDEAQLAVNQVNQVLTIKSTNRPGDQPSPGGIALLGQKKQEFTQALSEKKSALIPGLEIELKTRESHVQALLKKIAPLNEKIHTDKTLDPATKENLRQEAQRDMRARDLLISECSQLKRELEATRNFSIEEDARITAKAAKAALTGNCEEKASIAFFFLKKRPIRPIELMCSGPRRDDPNDTHQFVVIGRKADEPIIEPEKWTEAAVCDPWADLVYAPDVLPDKLVEFGYVDTISSCLREER